MEEKYLISNGLGKKAGKVGVQIRIFNRLSNKTKSITVHGFEVKELYDKIYFTIYHETKETTDKVYREAEEWKIQELLTGRIRKRNLIDELWKTGSEIDT